MEIVFGGDFFPGRRWENKIIQDPNSIWSKDVSEYINSADIRVVNLETPLTKSNNEINKVGPNLKCHPNVVKALKSARINLVSLANNHIYDFGHEGLINTMSVLKENDINFIGVGNNIHDAKKSIWIADDVVFLNYGQNEWGVATETSSGFNGYSLIDIVQEIKNQKSKNKFVCLILHRGHEHFSYPSPHMVKEYHFFIDNGADLIISHHSHFYSGYEKYKTGHILYGMGNMLFDSTTKDARWYESFLLKIKIKNKLISKFEIFPIHNSYDAGGINSMSPKGAFFKKISDINNIISNPTKLKQKWDEHLDYMEASYAIKLTDKSKYRLALLNRFPFLKNFLIPKLQCKLAFRNYFECEAHSELIKDLFKK